MNNTTIIGNNNNDAINPKHYQRGSKSQLIELIRLMPFSIGNSIKYCYRNGAKSTNAMIQDLEKALWYLNDYHQHSEVMKNNNTMLLKDLGDTVFNGLPEWELKICSMINDYYIMNVMIENSEITMDELEKFYDEIVETIISHISDLS